MNRAASCLWISGLAVSVMGGLAACEADETLGRGPQFELPDGSLSPFDAGTTGFDAGDPPDASDPVDAADAADASDGAVDVSYPGIVGTAGGSLYEDRCPAGQLVVGLEGGTVGGNFYAGVLTKVRTLCGTPKLPAGGATAITIEPGVTVPADAANARGQIAATTAVTQVMCPADQVVVGIRGNTIPKNFPPVRDLATYVQIACAPLSYANGIVTIGAAAVGAGGVGTPSPAVVGPFDCGANTAAAGMRVHAGEVADGVQARCEPVVVLP